jgi:YARHG domain
MRTAIKIYATACVLALIGSIPAHAQLRGGSCEQLWYARNKVFADAGYCFKSRRAIAIFGNAGCLYDNEWNVPLSENWRDVLSRIRLTERYQGCAPEIMDPRR